MAALDTDHKLNILWKFNLSSVSKGVIVQNNRKVLLPSTFDDERFQQKTEPLQSLVVSHRCYMLVIEAGSQGGAMSLVMKLRFIGEFNLQFFKLHIVFL